MEEEISGFGVEDLEWQQGLGRGGSGLRRF